MKHLIPVGVVVVALGLAGVAGAQILTGSIIGSVKDESGGALPGVTTSSSSSSAHPRGPLTVVTNETGEYRFTELPPGDLHAARDPRGVQHL